MATSQFYTEELHFTLGGLHHEAEGGPPTMCSVFVGDKAVVNIYHGLSADKDFTPGWVSIAMGKPQLEEYYGALAAAAAAGRVEIMEPIGDRPWGYRQFSIKDGDGNKLTFFCFLEGGNNGTE